MADEKVFFDNGTVRVTNTRVVASGKTFAVNQITSVEPLREAFNYKLLAIGLVIFFIGMFLTFVSTSTAIIFMLIGGGLTAVFVYSFIKPLYYVQLWTSAGKAHAMSHRDKTLIFQIIDAINDAIVHRG